ncbi:DUF6249 domain-containing protein [Sunxiuqinia sp. A32]|uniref:DUF6249 domain-containing protein n=1 Tax=Sunxiuqinia sp. A32 TaxID=3461496 RepID=UPI0040466AE1
MNEAIMIPLIVFAFIFASLYVFLTVRNKERMAMIEKGADPELFKSRPKVSNFLTLKFGLFFMGIAIGVLMGNILEVYTGLNDGASYLSMIFLFGGLGLVAGYLFQSNIEKKE